MSTKAGCWRVGGGCGSGLARVDYARVPSTLVGGSPNARKTKAPETFLLTVQHPKHWTPLLVVLIFSAMRGSLCEVHMSLWGAEFAAFLQCKQ
ncbi:Hok/Gef family protein [Salmonella enterica]|nr:Hok/Gef family protein [Salmonella enterica]EEM8614152.1 Hok/Gef family protein [Salmonella enterica]EEN5778105.1 Hok/Gef family protein [Salmonella enterica]